MLRCFLPVIKYGTVCICELLVRHSELIADDDLVSDKL